MITKKKQTREETSMKAIRTMRIMIFGTCLKMRITVKRRKSSSKTQAFGSIRRTSVTVC